MNGELNEGLLPCPFCGSIPEDNEFGTKVIHLSNECFLRDHEYSIEDWNVRAPSVSSATMKNEKLHDDACRYVKSITESADGWNGFAHWFYGHAIRDAYIAGAKSVAVPSVSSKAIKRAVRRIVYHPGLQNDMPANDAVAIGIKILTEELRLK